MIAARDDAELRAVRELRPRLRRLWEVDEEAVVEIINGLLRDANALPQLVRHDEWDYHLHATPPEAPLATRMAVEAAMAFVDVVRSERVDPPADLRVPDVRERASSTCRRTGRSASARPAAATARPSPPTAPAGPLPTHDQRD